MAGVAASQTPGGWEARQSRVLAAQRSPGSPSPSPWAFLAALGGLVPSGCATSCCQLSAWLPGALPPPPLLVFFPFVKPPPAACSSLISSPTLGSSGLSPYPFSQFSVLSILAFLPGPHPPPFPFCYAFLCTADFSFAFPAEHEGLPAKLLAEPRISQPKASLQNLPIFLCIFWSFLPTPWARLIPCTRAAPGLCSPATGAPGSVPLSLPGSSA